MKYLYTIGIYIYGFILQLASLFVPKAKLWIDGRKNWAAKISKHINKKDQVLWIHCSSLGEFEQGRPLIEKLKINYPDHKIAVSFFSPSGYEVRKNYKEADLVFYLPLDTVKNAKILVQVLHPKVLFLVKYEYWFHLLSELNAKQIPVIGVSSIFRENQMYFKGYGQWFRKELNKITHFFVQDINSEKLLNQIGISQTTLAGDTRFDRVKEILSQPNHQDFMQAFKGDTNVIIGGSTWPVDEQMFVELMQNQFADNWKLVLAPHEIHPDKISELLLKFNLPAVIYSDIKNLKVQESELKSKRILIIDVIGILTQIYAFADISYVGGGFGKGIHNTLEPAVYGVPVVFGPKYKKFEEAKAMVANKGGFSMKNSNEFLEIMQDLMGNKEKRVEAGRINSNFILHAPSATKMILDYAKSLIQ